MDINKICRVCLEESVSGVLTSIYSTDFAMMPSTMLMMCTKVRVFKTDGLPSMICNNCIYRLGVTYHFKQECENSDIRLRQYLGIHGGYGFCDATTMTDDLETKEKSEDDDDSEKKPIKKSKKSRYQRKAPEDVKKRGPKPIPKVPQTCYECSKTFKCSAQLQLHIRTHTGERPFSCSYCPRRFAQKYNLLIHIRTHTGYKPFQCEICSKQFSALGNFQAHQKIHSGIKDHVCPACNKGFYSSGDLAKHMVTHTGIKNHHCDICGKNFSRNRDMVAHKKKIHLNDRSSGNFKCPECRKVFANLSSLNIHYRTHETNTNLGLQSTTVLQPMSNIIQTPLAAPAALHQPTPSVPVTTVVPTPTYMTNANFTASSLGSSIGMSIGFPPPPPPPPHSSLGMLPHHHPHHHPQSSFSMMHTQRLHPY